MRKVNFSSMCHIFVISLGHRGHSLLRSVHTCVRGSRTPFRNKIEQSLDCKINVASADI